MARTHLSDTEYCQWNTTHLLKNWALLITISPYNGLAEKLVQTIKRMLNKSKRDGQDPYLSLLELRNTRVGDIGSPAQLLMSR